MRINPWTSGSHGLVMDPQEGRDFPEVQLGTMICFITIMRDDRLGSSRDAQTSIRGRPGREYLIYNFNDIINFSTSPPTYHGA